MNIDELYQNQGIAKDPTRKVNMPQLPELKLPYEEILPVYEPVDFQLDILPNLNNIISKKSGTFLMKGLPVIIYERRHTNDKKRGEQGYYPFTYHMFYCSHLKKIYGSMDEVKRKFNVTNKTGGMLDVFIGTETKKREVRHSFCWDCYDFLGKIVGRRNLEKHCGTRLSFSLPDFCTAVEKGLFPPVKGLEDFDRFRVFRNKDVYYNNQYWREYAYLRKAASGFKCEHCGKIFKDKNGQYIEKSLQVHHIDKNPLNMDPKDHIVLCVECHKKEHSYKEYKDVE